MPTARRSPALLLLLLPLVLVLVTSLSGGLGQSASAEVGHQQRRAVRTTIVMPPTSFDQTTFLLTVKGTVRAADKRCSAKRAVTITTTNSSTGETIDLGTKRANASGRFRFTYSFDILIVSDGNFTATIDQLRTGGTRPVTCTAASTTVR